jgi:hypothetical protein
MAESPETRQLVGAIQVYNQSLIKLDPDTQKGASAIGLSIGDILAPEQLQTKLDGAKDYAAARLKTFADENISQRVNPGNPSANAAPAAAPAASTPAAAPTPPAIGTMMIARGVPNVPDGTALYRVAGGWSTVTPQ